MRKYHDVVLVDVSKGSSAQKSKQFRRVFRDGVVFVVANHNALDVVKQVNVRR